MKKLLDYTNEADIFKAIYIIRSSLVKVLLCYENFFAIENKELVHILWRSIHFIENNWEYIEKKTDSIQVIRVWKKFNVPISDIEAFVSGNNYVSIIFRDNDDSIVEVVTDMCLLTIDKQRYSSLFTPIHSNARVRTSKIIKYKKNVTIAEEQIKNHRQSEIGKSIYSTVIEVESWNHYQVSRETASSVRKLFTDRRLMSWSQNSE